MLAVKEDMKNIERQKQTRQKGLGKRVVRLLRKGGYRTPMRALKRRMISSVMKRGVDRWISSAVVETALASMTFSSPRALSGSNPQRTGVVGAAGSTHGLWLVTGRCGPRTKALLVRRSPRSACPYLAGQDQDRGFQGHRIRAPRLRRKRAEICQEILKIFLAVSLKMSLNLRDFLESQAPFEALSGVPTDDLRARRC